MASIIKVDTIQASNGTPLHVNGYPTQTGQIIECLSSPCDGSTVVGLSGSYTWPSVIVGQSLTTTYADASGSSISYIPPSNATKVIYEYTANLGWNNAHAISHWRLYIDGIEVVYARTNRSGYYPEDKTTLKWVFNIGNSTDNNTGRQATWTTAKILKWQVRDYGTGNRRLRLHTTTYWDGAGGNQFSMPILTLTAIA